MIFGILLVGETPYDHSDPWISVAYLVWVISFLFGVVAYPRVQKKIDSAAAEQGASSAQAAGHVRTFLNLNTIEITLLLLVVIDMAVKPGA